VLQPGLKAADETPQSRLGRIPWTFATIMFKNRKSQLLSFCAAPPVSYGRSGGLEPDK